MTKEYNIIGDIAGQYKTLLALLAKMPNAATPLSLGDMVDRGPQSREVIQFFMDHGEAVMGNHEHMMVDAVKRLHQYRFGVWQFNGGDATLNSYKGEDNADIPKEHIDWLEELPFYRVLEDGLGYKTLVTHAPLASKVRLGEALRQTECYPGSKNTFNLLWNREPPGPNKEYKIQIYGHNSFDGLKYHGDYAMCIDTSGDKILTGVHFPSMKVYQQGFVE